MGTTPREAALASGGPLPRGTEDRVQGYGVMGVPLESGDYLALRRWAASSFGPGYTSVWHRDPAGRWTIYADQPPVVSCARYLGPAAQRLVTAPVRLTWSDDTHLTIEVDALRWGMSLVTSAATVALTGAGSVLPDAAWASPTVLRLMGWMAGPLLDTGPLRLVGLTPSGHAYRVAARRTWLVQDTWAEDAGRSLGHEARPDGPVTIGPLLLPQRGVFYADATARFATPAPHAEDHHALGRHQGASITTGGGR